MRNILEKVRKSDYDEVKTGAQAIYLAPSRAQAEAAFGRFRMRWRREYGSVRRELERASGVQHQLEFGGWIDEIVENTWSVRGGIKVRGDL